MPRIQTCVALLLVVMSPLTVADNWGHWRGPRGNGSAATANPPTEWSSTKNVKWKVEVPGIGSSSPVIWGDQVFLTTAVSKDGGNARSLTTLEFQLLCFDRKTGKLVWQKTSVVAKPHQETHNTNGFASASPCTDGEHVYAHFGSRGLYCYTMNGDLVWKRDDFGRMQTRNSFGEGSSPTLEGNMILVPWDHEGPSALYALDKLTGQTIWKADRDEPSCWATPLVVEHAGRKQVVMNGQTCARSYDLETGKELWRCAGQTERPCALTCCRQRSGVCRKWPQRIFPWSVSTGWQGGYSAHRERGLDNHERHAGHWFSAVSNRANLLPQGQVGTVVVRRCGDWKTVLHGQPHPGARQHLRISDCGRRSCLPDLAQRHHRRDQRRQQSAD